MKLIYFSVFLMLFTFLAHAEPIKPQYSGQFILERILEYKNLTLNPSIEIPQIVYSSEVSLQEFQNDIESQWGFRPDVITNAYVVKLNKIYLYDSKEYYSENERCIDDSLAHELAHFVQVKYREWDLNDESLEWDAIDTQTWFRTQYCQK